MTVERIFVRQSSVDPQTEHECVEVVAGAGIKGDRYFDRHDEPGQNITLIEAEEIEFFTSEYQRAPDLSISNRNIVTRGVRLNGLVGREFMIGEIKLRGLSSANRVSVSAMPWPHLSYQRRRLLSDFFTGQVFARTSCPTVLWLVEPRSPMPPNPSFKRTRLRRSA